MNLLVIEGVGKEPTIKKYLGKDWEVFATKGHVRDLPEKSFGLDVKDNFAPQYTIMKDKEYIVKKLKEKASKAEKVFLATDPDREGEAISWHLAYILGYDKDALCRVEFNEITKDVILKALNKPRKINEDLVDAQQARRVLDRIVGYKISPIICKKLTSNLSAGRVQSVALKLVVDREREILNFKPEEYWTINALLEKENEKPEFKANLAQYKGKKLKVKNEQQKNEILEQLKQNNFVVKSVKKQVSLSHAPAPFTTSALQQDASNKLSFSTQTTTKVAQELYEGVELGEEGKIALVTYIRTDSVRVSEEAQAKALEYIKNTFGYDYAPKKPNVYKTKGNAQDAHEAIRPTHIERTPESIKPFVKPECYKLYKLIYERFLASQMSNAEYNQVTSEIQNGDYTFKVVGKALKFAGFTAIYQNYKDTSKEDEDVSVKLPNLIEGDLLKCKDMLFEQKFTKPTPRYNEGSLVKEMEENGIGRPATYSAIISVLYFRKYVEKEGKSLKPTDLGFKVNDLLQKYFADIMNVSFTSNMETKLDEIAENGKDWKEVVNSFYMELLPQLRNANMDKDAVQKEVQYSDVKCSKCGALMVYKESKFGKFLGCSNYPKCKNIQSLTEIKVVGKCPNCGQPLQERKTKKGTIYYSCKDYKNCKFMSWDLPLEEKCPKCDCYLLEKKGKSGTFKKCSNENCDYFEKVLPPKKKDNTNDEIVA